MIEKELKTPKGMRLHIGIFGERNAGKSSLLNRLTGQSIAIVDPTPGTTTDVVSKTMELKPIGPVVFMDTAGLDDIGDLGKKRVEKSMGAIDQVDLALLVCEKKWNDHLDMVIAELDKRHVPYVIIFNKSDIYKYDQYFLDGIQKKHKYVTAVSSATGDGFDHLRTMLVEATPKSFLENPQILSDIVSPGDVVILVVPIDLEAPRGRLILPQVQVLRELLDIDAKAVVVKENALTSVLNDLKHLPKLVVTDSQAILQVVNEIPDSLMVTGFSVLFARWKGDLETFVDGLKKIDHLKDFDRILILESCTHHPVEDDIGRVKIPKWLRQYTGLNLEFVHKSGHDLPERLDDYSLIIHCGSCMGNRQQMLSRILKAKEAGIPITNYGLAIAKSLGVLDRMLSPFPHLRELPYDLKG